MVEHPLLEAIKKSIASHLLRIPSLGVNFSGISSHSALLMDSNLGFSKRLFLNLMRLMAFNEIAGLCSYSQLRKRLVHVLYPRFCCQLFVDGVGRYEFQFVMSPLILPRGTASPVNPVAIF